MKKSWILVLSSLVVCVIGIVACGGGEGDPLEAAAEDMKKSGEALAGDVEDVVNSVTDGSGDAVQQTIDTIKSKLAEKESELKAIKDKLAGMSPADLTGENAAKLKEQSAGLAKEIQALKDKLEAALKG